MAHLCINIRPTLLYTTCHSCLFCIMTLQNRFNNFVLGGLATECSATCQCPSVSIKDRVRKCFWKRACNASSVCWPGTEPCIYKAKYVSKVAKKVKKHHFWGYIVCHSWIWQCVRKFCLVPFLPVLKHSKFWYTQFNVHSDGSVNTMGTNLSKLHNFPLLQTSLTCLNNSSMFLSWLFCVLGMWSSCNSQNPFKRWQKQHGMALTHLVAYPLLWWYQLSCSNNWNKSFVALWHLAWSI